MCKYPGITVNLIGESDNAFAILGKVTRALKRAKVSRNIIAEFQKEAMANDYDALLRTCIKWVNVE